jgi:putative nucleotidyltransferase with HDIG domain
MPSHTPSYEEAYSLLHEYNNNPRLLEHAYAVEATMQYYARKLGENEVKWRIIGLVHDLDSELFQKEHCIKTGEILRKEKWPEEYIHAIQSHGWEVWCAVQPELPLEKILYTIDKVTWFVAYVTIKSPTRKLADVDVKLVMAKWDDESFAPGRNRQILAKGAAMLETDVEVLFTDVIAAMRPVAGKLGL